MALLTFGGRRSCRRPGPRSLRRFSTSRAVAASLVALSVLTSLAVRPGVAGAAGVPRFSSPVELNIGTRVGMDPTRMAAGDLNGDGNVDLASTQWTSGTVAVFFGKGTGSFLRRVVYRTPRHPSGIAVADIDGDGDQDVVTASGDRAGSVSIFSNSGAGGLQRLATYASSAKAYAVAAADLDQDGTLDLVTANYNRQHLNVLQGQGGGRFSVTGQYTGAPANDVVLGDVNGDGNLDVALATKYKPGSVVVRLGNGTGMFGPARTHKSGLHPWGLALADFNHDGNLDIAAATYDGGAVHVLMGPGDGTFAASGKYRMGPWSYPDAVLVGDFDRDGHPDIATSSLEGPIVLRGRGDGTFFRRQRVSPSGLSQLELECCLGAQGGAVADFNGDGWPDLAFAQAEFGEQKWWNYVLVNWTAQPAPPCVVPDIRYDRSIDLGVRLRLAITAIRSGGCELGSVSRRYSRKVDKRDVISQTPQPNEVLPSHSPVDIVVSRGRRR
jgi:hypothetical protein